MVFIYFKETAKFPKFQLKIAYSTKIVKIVYNAKKAIIWRIISVLSILMKIVLIIPFKIAKSVKMAIFTMNRNISKIMRVT